MIAPNGPCAPLEPDMAASSMPLPPEGALWALRDEFPKLQAIERAFHDAGCPAAAQAINRAMNQAGYALADEIERRQKLATKEPST